MVVALAVPLVAATPAFAKDRSDVSEKVVVRNALSLVLDGAPFDYGTVDPGAASSGIPLKATVTAPNGTAWQLVVNGTALTSGSNSMPSSVRSVSVDGQGVWTPLSKNLVLASSTGGDRTVKMSWRVTVPAGQADGTYTGHLTFSVAAP